MDGKTDLCLQKELASQTRSILINENDLQKLRLLLFFVEFYISNFQLRVKIASFYENSWSILKTSESIGKKILTSGSEVEKNDLSVDDDFVVSPLCEPQSFQIDSGELGCLIKNPQNVFDYW